ncbi:DUF4344 domain-containing metallopeptidase [Acinetobacter sp. AS167]|uniref:DUF4344 domain-containing metallopeptidase n=1 Tax=Acinetobacter sp. AS167 TaxID=3127884 RepID=UPI003018234D
MKKYFSTNSRFLGIFSASLMTFLILTGCEDNSDSKITSWKSQPTNESITAKGKFIPVYEPALKAENRIEENLWRSHKLLEDFTDEMNDFVKIPRDIKVISKECNESNAFYDRENYTIELCYELGVEERKMFSDVGDSGEVLDNLLYQSAVGTLFHEAGHALIAVLDLKITGREEDVADQLAAYILTYNNEDKDYLITVSETYSLAAQRAESLDDLLFYDSHSLDAQRAVNFLCYVYGSDPKGFNHLIGDELLNKDRAEDCEFEYQQIVDAWDFLLGPYFKNNLDKK